MITQVWAVVLCRNDATRNVFLFDGSSFTTKHSNFFVLLNILFHPGNIPSNYWPGYVEHIRRRVLNRILVSCIHFPYAIRHQLIGNSYNEPRGETWVRQVLNNTMGTSSE